MAKRKIRRQIRTTWMTVFLCRSASLTNDQLCNLLLSQPYSCGLGDGEVDARMEFVGAQLVEIQS